MNDLQSLRDRLITLAGPAEPRIGRLRILDLSVSGGAQAAFENEISQTPLPRQLSFQNSAGLRITLTAAGGRITSLDAASLPDNTKPALPMTLTEEDPEAVSLASVLLSRLLSKTDTLGVEVAWNTIAQVGLGLGVSASLLRARAAPLAETTPPFEAFLNHIQANCGAWIVLRAGQIAELEGDRIDRARLQKLAETLDAPEMDGVTGLTCVMLTPKNSTKIILCVSDEDSLAFATMPNSAVSTVLDGWRGLKCAS